MFTLTNKLRTIIAIGAVGATLVSAGTASATTRGIAHSPGLNPALSDAVCTTWASVVNTYEAGITAATNVGNDALVAQLTQKAEGAAAAGQAAGCDLTAAD